MLHNSNKLQMAAVVCVQNLTWTEDDGAADRQSKLRDMGVYKILQQLLTSTDTGLFEKYVAKQFRSRNKNKVKRINKNDKRYMYKIEKSN